jgi:O-antigen/teichoic acid export membrane protein
MRYINIMNNLFKKFLEFAIGNGIVLILGFFSTFIIGRTIDPTQNGKASMFITYTSLIVLVLTMGIDQAYIRFYNDETYEGKKVLLRKSIKIPILMTLIFGSIIILFYKIVSNIMIDETSLFLIILLVINSLFTIIWNFAMINVRMKQKGKAYSLLNAANKGIYIILIIIFYYIFKGNYITLILATVISNIIMVILAVFYEKEDWIKKIKLNHMNTNMKELVSYGVPFIFSMAIIWVFQSIDRIFIKTFSDFEQVGLYSGAMNIVSLLTAVQGVFTTFWTPVAYERFSKEPNDTEFFTNINQIVSIVMILLSIGLIASKDILIMILGKKYDGAQYIFPFLVLMPIMYTISETTVLGINFKKKTKYHIYIAVISATSNVIGNFILVPIYGAKGAAISTGLSYVVFFLSRTYFAKRFYKIKLYMWRFLICITSVYIFAIYSSIYKFNYVILCLSIFNIILVIVMYKDIIFSLLNILKKHKNEV